MDSTQFVIVFVSVSLTLLTFILGIQVYFILREFRLSVQKMNKMLDDIGRVTNTVGSGVENIGGFIGGIRAGAEMASSILGKKRGTS